MRCLTVVCEDNTLHAHTRRYTHAELMRKPTTRVPLRPMIIGFFFFFFPTYTCRHICRHSLGDTVRPYAEIPEVKPSKSVRIAMPTEDFDINGDIDKLREQFKDYLDTDPS